MRNRTWWCLITICDTVLQSIKYMSAESNNNYTQTSPFCFLSRLAVVLFHCNSFHWPYLFKITDFYNGHFCSYMARASNMIQYSIMMLPFEALCIWKLKTEFVLCCQSALFRCWCESFLYFQTYCSTGYRDYSAGWWHVSVYFHAACALDSPPNLLNLWWL